MTTLSVLSVILLLLLFSSLLVSSLLPCTGIPIWRSNFLSIAVPPLCRAPRPAAATSVAKQRCVRHSLTGIPILARRRPALANRAEAFSHGFANVGFEVVGRGKSVRLITPGKPARPLLAREQLDVRTGAKALDSLVLLIGLAGVLPARSNDQLADITG